MRTFATCSGVHLQIHVQRTRFWSIIRLSAVISMLCRLDHDCCCCRTLLLFLLLLLEELALLPKSNEISVLPDNSTFGLADVRVLDFRRAGISMSLM